MASVYERRKKTIADAKSRYDAKRRKEGKRQTQVWLLPKDYENIELIKEDTGLKTNSDVISHALSVAAIEAEAQADGQLQSKDAQDHVHDIE